MREMFILTAHLLVTLAKLARPGRLKPTKGRIPNDPTLGMQQWNDTSVHPDAKNSIRGSQSDSPSPRGFVCSAARRVARFELISGLM